MKLILWQRIVDLARIPRSDGNHAVDAIDGINFYGAPAVEIIMLSHRWLRPARERSAADPDFLDKRHISGSTIASVIGIVLRTFIADRHQ